MTNQQTCGHTPLFAEDSIRWVERVLPCLYCERDRLREHVNSLQNDLAKALPEIARLRLRESRARAILEPLAEHDPAIRQWLKGLPVDTQVERLRAALTWLRAWRKKDPESIDHEIQQALSGEPPSPAEPTAQPAHQRFQGEDGWVWHQSCGCAYCVAETSRIALDQREYLRRVSEKSSAVLDHRFLPDGMDPGICQKCGSTRTSHRDQQ